MNKTCAFTIVAKNYIGLGLILGESLRTHNPDIDFRIVVADEFDSIPSNLPNEVVFAKDFLGWEEERWKKMTFQYDLTQFCTSIKPGSILHFMDEGYDKVLYFDPDIYIFSSLNEIIDCLEVKQIVLTPQIARVHIDYKGEHPEWAMNCNGIFNLGFGGYRNTQKVRNILRWWDKRLETECFSDRTVGNFTDQKWMDWVPGFMTSEEFSSLDSLGMNMAPWNFFERKLVQKNGLLFVTDREECNDSRFDKLVFIHFAGYDYSAFKKGEIKRKRIQSLNDYEDLLLAVSIYRDAISQKSKTFDLFIQQPYSYSTYDNGDVIEPFHRRLYHGLLMNGECLSCNPFLTGEGSFYEQLRKNRLLDVTKANLHLSRHSAGDVSSKRRIIEALLLFIKRVGGYKRYVPFTKALIDYCRPEFNVFLIDKNKIVK